MSQESHSPAEHPTLDELWRRALGRQLRALRLARGERLDDTAARAGISPQYLSEVERGRKDPSSEMIGAVIGALGSTLAETLLRVARDLDNGTDVRTAEIIELPSSTRFSQPSARPDASEFRRPDATLLVAA